MMTTTTTASEAARNYQSAYVVRVGTGGGWGGDARDMYKYGFTTDWARRRAEHVRTFGPCGAVPGGLQEVLVLEVVSGPHAERALAAALLADDHRCFRAVPACGRECFLAACPGSVQRVALAALAPFLRGGSDLDGGSAAAARPVLLVPPPGGECAAPPEDEAGGLVVAEVGSEAHRQDIDDGGTSPAAPQNDPVQVCLGFLEGKLAETRGFADRLPDGMVPIAELLDELLLAGAGAGGAGGGGTTSPQLLASVACRFLEGRRGVDARGRACLAFPAMAKRCRRAAAAAEAAAAHGARTSSSLPKHVEFMLAACKPGGAPAAAVHVPGGGEGAFQITATGIHTAYMAFCGGRRGPVKSQRELGAEIARLAARAPAGAIEKLPNKRLHGSGTCVWYTVRPDLLVPWLR